MDRLATTLQNMKILVFSLFPLLGFFPVLPSNAEDAPHAKGSRMNYGAEYPAEFSFGRTGDMPLFKTKVECWLSAPHMGALKGVPSDAVWVTDSKGKKVDGKVGSTNEVITFEAKEEFKKGEIYTFTVDMEKVTLVSGKKILVNVAAEQNLRMNDGKAEFKFIGQAWANGLKGDEFLNLQTERKR